MSNRIICDTLNHNYWIRVLFHGLMTGCFRDGKTYETGVLKNSPPQHTLKLSVWEKSSGRDVLVAGPYKIGDGLKRDSVVRLVIKDPAQGYDKVCRYQKGAQFDRHDPATDRHDFRWSTDFENDEFFPQKLEKRAGDLIPRLRVENSGTFLTLIRSVPLIIEKARRIRLLGRVTQITGAHIQPAGSAELIIPDIPNFPFDPHKRYDVVLRNDCLDHPDCFDDDDTVDTTFLMEAVRVPAGQERIRLVVGLDNESARRMMEKEINGIELGELGDVFKFLSDEKIRASRYNPCGKAFYGQSDSLD